MIEHRGDLHDGIHDEIINIDTFNLAQKIRKENAEKRNLGDPTRGHLLLNGIIKCGFCNRYMTTRGGTGRNKTYYYYVCTRITHEGAKACLSSQIKSEDIESLIVDIIRELANNDEYLNETVNLVNNSADEEIEEKNNEVMRIRKMKKQIENEQKDLVKLLTEHKLQKVKVIASEIKDKEFQVAELSVGEKDLETEIEESKTGLVDVKTVAKIYKQFHSMWDELDQEDKRDLIKILVKEIEVYIEKKAKTGEIKIALWTEFPKGLLSTYKIGSSSCRVGLRRAGEKTNRIILPFQIRYMQYKQGGTYYYFPEVTIENGRLNATFYRNRGLKGVKFTREELQAYWQAKSTVRAGEYQKLIEENGWNKADLARHLGVSRAWVTIVMRELG